MPKDDLLAKMRAKQGGLTPRDATAPKPAAPAKPAKPPAKKPPGPRPPRKCCASPKGKDSPHAEGCPYAATEGKAKPRKKKPRTPPSDTRLPHGARFEMDYNGETTRWAGTLAIPGFPVFKASASALFKLCSTLDWDYRYAARAKLRAEQRAAGVPESPENPNEPEKTEEPEKMADS